MNTVDKVLKIAMDEVGYLEKSKTAYQKNHDIIYEKTAGAGSDNYTKYNYEMHKLYPSVMDFPCFWCASFVHWCFYKAFGYESGNAIVYGYNDYTVASSGNYAKHNALDTNVKIGDQVFFTKNGKTSGCYHTGLVYQVDNTYFYTIEGNTSGGSSVVANGGGVAKKKYSIAAYKGKVLFGHPKYDTQLKSIDEIALEVIAGKWGNGNEVRRANLTAAGYNYALVRARVNELYNPKPKVITDIPKYSWDYLMKEINNPYGVAGLMGNIQAESGFKPNNLQNSCEKKLGMDDATYTAAVDSGAYGNFAVDRCGFGICQWSSENRKRGLYDLAKQKKVSISDITLQLEYLVKELKTSYKSTLNALKTATSVRSASDVVLTKFERPKDQSEAVKIKRAAYGDGFYQKYGAKT